MQVRLEEKEYLNLKETIEFYNFSARKFRRLVIDGNLVFIARYKNRLLIIKNELENYLNENPKIKEELKRGKARWKKKR